MQALLLLNREIPIQARWYFSTRVGLLQALGRRDRKNVVACHVPERVCLISRALHGRTAAGQRLAAITD
jgi:hypothetical protein